MEFTIGGNYAGIVVQLIPPNARKPFYGFISSTMGTVYVSGNELRKKQIIVGNEISFTLTRNDKGYKAINCIPSNNVSVHCQLLRSK
jgi:cold shock CspA family protein